MSQSNYERAVKQGSEKAHDAIHAAADKADDVAQRASGAAAAAGAAVRDAAGKAYDATNDLSHRAYDKGSRYGQDVIDQVEQQPLMALAIAAGIGFFVGMLMRRR